MTTPNRIRRLAATVAVTALPLSGASALLSAHPAAAQVIPVNPFGTTGFAPSTINFHPDNSTTEVNNYGDNNTTVVDDGSSNPWWGDTWGGGGWNHDWDFPWWNDGWNWNPGNNGGWDNGGWW